MVCSHERGGRPIGEEIRHKAALNQWAIVHAIGAAQTSPGQGVTVIQDDEQVFGATDCSSRHSGQPFRCSNYPDTLAVDTGNAARCASCVLRQVGTGRAAQGEGDGILRVCSQQNPSPTRCACTLQETRRESGIALSLLRSGTCFSLVGGRWIRRAGFRQRTKASVEKLQQMQNDPGEVRLCQ